ncbi:MAG: shikimate kinase [Flavobacteriales bacterium]|nr:shikimate kinase [Flavobacteriales bacterium]MCC6938156.1 shikimate kinase [Flavobacteriales bacterium]
MRLFLIGFMCSGKTTVGRELAKLMEMPFVDLDRVAEERVGPLLPFIQREGEAAFRKVEAEVLEELMNGPDAVIATGGGTPCELDHMARMKSAGKVIWLDVPLEALMPRIERSGGDRPLLFGLKGEALMARVYELLDQRTSTYAEADVIVQANATPTVVAQRIAAVVR